MTKRLYLQCMELLETTATIQMIGSDARGNYVRLDQTPLHAQGGGQQADGGALDGFPVFHVAQTEEGEVNHYVNQSDVFRVGQQVIVTVDATRRRPNAAYHTAGHLLANLAESIFPIRALGGHHWPGEARVEFEATSQQAFPDGNRLIEGVSALAEQAIAADLAIQVLGDPYRARTIQIGNYPPIACGGCHCSHLGGISLTIQKVKMKDGRLRVSYQCRIDESE